MVLKHVSKNFGSIATCISLGVFGILIPQMDTYFPNNVYQPMQMFLEDALYRSTNFSQTNSSIDIDEYLISLDVSFHWGVYISMLSIAAIAVAIAAPFMVNKMGRKQSYILFSLISSLAKFLQWMAKYNALPLLYIGRFLSGIGNCGINTIVPVIVNEISEKSVRGTLGSVLSFAHTLGSVLTALLGLNGLFGNYSWNWAFFWLFVFSLTAFPLVAIMKETPVYLASKIEKTGPEKVLRSLLFYRGTTEDFDSVLEDSRLDGTHMNAFRQCVSLMSDKTVRSQTLITIAVKLTYVPVFLTGIYSTLMFSAGGLSNEQATYGTLTVTAYVCIVVLIAIFTADRCGRRSIALWSCSIAFVSLCLMTVIQFLVDHMEPNLVPFHLPWMQTFLIFLLKSAISFGPRTLYWILIPEIYPFKYRMSANFCGLLIFQLVNIFYVTLLPPIFDVGYGWLVYLLLALQVGWGTWVIWKFLPETKNLRPEEIYLLFNPDQKEFILNRSITDSSFL